MPKQRKKNKTKQHKSCHWKEKRAQSKTLCIWNRMKLNSLKWNTPPSSLYQYALRKTEACTQLIKPCTGLNLFLAHLISTRSSSISRARASVFTEAIRTIQVLNPPAPGPYWQNIESCFRLQLFCVKTKSQLHMEINLRRLWSYWAFRNVRMWIHNKRLQY